MCGIAGYYGRGNEEVLKAMATAIKYRGPDDEGYYIDGAVGLAHKRLSIIDLSSQGHQPMADESGNVQVIFNGEIYNFEDLRETIKSKHTFKGHSDTEVIAHLYEDIGQEVFSKLEGMFAIALYDKKEGKLILARDRMGKKPLYYGIFEGTLIFGSELKALIQHPLFERKLDVVSLNKYLQYEYVPTPHTIFKNVYKLEPGHYAVFDGSNLLKTRFWNIPIEQLNEENLSTRDLVSRFDTLLNDAVKKRLASDVPLGVFLSGGIDSSTIAYYAQKIAEERSLPAVKTFSIGFKEDSFDESKFARSVAAHLGTEHHEKILSAGDSLSIIPKIIDELDEPMSDPSIIPTYLLSQFAKENVTVALGGDGGDELLSGYDTFIADKLASAYEVVPFPLRKYFIEKIVPLLPVSSKNMSFDFRAKKFISGFYGDKRYRNQRWLGAFNKSERAALFKSGIWQDLRDVNEFDDIDRYVSELNINDYDKELTYIYLRMYMMDNVLVKVDRASMYNSLEVRSPFLDTDVVRFLVNVPKRLKLRGFTSKYLLKKLMDGKLPHDVINRKKKGFGIPLSKWLNNELKALCESALSSAEISSQGLFNPEYVEKLKQDHFSGASDNRKQLWNLMIFSLWHKKWLS